MLVQAEHLEVTTDWKISYHCYHSRSRCPVIQKRTQRRDHIGQRTRTLDEHSNQPDTTNECIHLWYQFDY